MFGHCDRGMFLTYVQPFAAVATTSSKGRNEQVESALFSRHERENTCTYFHVSLVFLSSFCNPQAADCMTSPAMLNVYFKHPIDCQ